MELVKQGLTSKEVARALGISHRTVDQHIAAAIENLGVPNRLAAVARLLEMEQEERANAPPPPFMLSYIEEPAVDLFEVVSEQEAESVISKTGQPTVDVCILPPLGGAPNTHPRRVRITMIARIATLSTMLTCFVILSVLGVIELASPAAS